MAPQPAMSANTTARIARERAMMRRDVAGGNSMAEIAANTLPRTSPTGVASSNPAFAPTSTPGVASACRPRKPAPTMNASETTNRRASCRRRAATDTV